MASPLPNPLLSLHEKLGAEFQSYDELQIVSTFGEPEAEYAAIRKGAALFDQPQRGILEVTGKDRLPFLNNLVTNQVWDKSAKRGLEAGHGVYAFFLGTNGRINTELNVLERGDRTLVEMDARLVEPTRVAFEKYLFAEQVKLTSRVGSLHEISIFGPTSLELLNNATGGELPELASLRSTEIRLFDTDVTLWRDDICGSPGYHLIFEVSQASRIWEQFVSRFAQPHEHGKRTLRPVGWAAFNATRIEAGRPIFGIDFDDSVLPHETGLLARAVSFTKGCYLGQEIVARMEARKQFARQIVGIKMADDALPIAGAMIQDDADNQIGAVTSSTISPVLSNAPICLALVKRQFTSIGTSVNVPAEGQMREGVVAELPFLGAHG